MKERVFKGNTSESKLSTINFPWISLNVNEERSRFA
jgi:hypothetical protein